MNVSYVLPIRRWSAMPDDEQIELSGYLRWLADLEGVEVIVVDGSARDLFAAHAAAWADTVRHVPVDIDLAGKCGKVNGVITGVRAARHDVVVIADDDVRYSRDSLAAAAKRMAERHADLVRPQNYFSPTPWHAKWDTARTLLNRAGSGDYPGTLIVRRATFLAAGGYDGDVLFENLELIRTIAAVGGRVVNAPDIYVLRRPPSAKHFWSQRVRQAYDDFALPVRMAGELSIVPLVVLASLAGQWRLMAAAVATSMAVAEFGRRRWGGRRVFPASAPLFAPLWLAERGVCAWLAVWRRLTLGGVPYAGTVLAKAANSRRRLRVQASRSSFIPSWEATNPSDS